MCLHNIPEARGRWHKHCVNIDLAKKQHGGVDREWEANVGSLANLALMTGVDKPFDIVLEGWPPESVEEGVVCQVKSLVAKLIMCVADKGHMLWRCGIQLVLTMSLALPKLSANKKKMLCSANETGECIARKVRRRMLGEEVVEDNREFFICLGSFEIWGESWCISVK